MTNPYSELTEKVEEGFRSLVYKKVAGDARLERFEKQKVLLLVLILASAWTIFFLLCARLDAAAALQFLPLEVKAQTHYQIKNGVRYAL